MDPESWSSGHIHQSQWLETTISDLDERLDAMITILEGINQQDMHCKRREDLIQMLEEFGQSYRVLAIAYNQVKFKTSNGTFHSGSLSSAATSKTMHATCKRTTGNPEGEKHEEGCNHHRKSLGEHSDIKLDGTNLDQELFSKQEDECYELLSADPSSVKCKPELEWRDTQMEDTMTQFSPDEHVFMKKEGLNFEANQKIKDPSMINFKFDNTWSTLNDQIMKLTQENLYQLVELVQRNEDKRETIRRLQSEVETLKRENKALQISLSLQC